MAMVLPKKNSESLMNFSSYYNMVLTRPLMQHRLDVLGILDWFDSALDCLQKVFNSSDFDMFVLEPCIVICEHFILFQLIFILCPSNWIMIVLINVTARPDLRDANELFIKKADFPNDFVFGVATAAAQVHLYFWWYMTLDPLRLSMVMFFNINDYVLLYLV